MRKSIIIGFITACLLACLYAAIYFYELNRSARDKTASMQAQVVELDKHLERLSFIPKLLSDDAHILTLVQNKNPENSVLANTRLQKIKQESGLDFAFLMDTKGNTIAASNWQSEVSFIGENYSFRPYFKKAMTGQRATYFAVGATTGVPGYFIAEPVLLNNGVAGVVVAKMALTAPVETWRSQPHDSAVVDEFGVVILSSNESLLYQTTRTQTTAELAAIQAERRYSVATPEQTDPQQPLAKYLTYSTALNLEPWQFYTLVPAQVIHWESLTKTAIILVGLLTLWLLYRTYEQQHRLVTNEQKHSKELEEKVRLRSDELERAQGALIAESNYAILGRMSAAINHEINQPLTTLRLNLASLRKLIENPVDNIGDIEQSVIESDRTTKRISRVITSLRNYTRSNSMNIESVSVNRLIADVVSIIQTERQTMSAHLVVQTPEAGIVLQADNVLIQQALLNLLYNAIDAVIANPYPQLFLTVSSPLSLRQVSPLFSEQLHHQAISYLDSDKNYIVIAVKDNGDGVPEHIVATLFEPFTTDKPNHRGLGLGLTIANQIAEGHKGLLMYARVDESSVFSLILPAKPL